MQSVNHMKRATLLALSLLVVLAPLPVGGQTRRAGGRARPPRPAPPAQSTQPPQQKGAPTEAGAVPRVELEQSPKSRALAEAFESGRLPEPARLPAGSVDEQAAELAKAVSKGDSSSTAALYAAILAAGYGVRDRDGAVLQTTERGQGLAFEWWEVAAVAKLYGEGYGAGLGHLSESFTRNVADLKGVALDAALLEGVRKAAQSDHPALRFWGRFIVELGRHSAEPYDLLGQVEPAKVRLDAVQINFILSRLAGDFTVAGRPEGAARLTPPAEAALDRGGRGAGVRFVKAGMRAGGGARPSPPQHPCGATDAQGLVLDANAAISTNLHGQLVKSYGMNGIRNANIVLSLLKFILSYAMLKSSIMVVLNPMERTKNTRHGLVNGLSVRVWIDNKAEALNCMRPFLNMMGLDFNLPNNGPVSGVKVVWAGVLGFDEGARDWRDDFLDHFTGDGARPADAILTFDAPWGVEQSRVQYTDRHGAAIIIAIGKPQARDLSREKLTEVLKVAGVRAWLQLKPTKIEDLTGGLSATVDALGVVNSFASLDIPSGVAGLITEAAYRLNWFPTKTFYFLVKDWEPCAGEWGGTITSSLHMKQTTEERLKTGYERDIRKTYSFNANITVDNLDAKATAGTEARGTIDASETFLDDQRSAPNIRITLRHEAEARYSGRVFADVSVYSGGGYSVRFGVPKMRGEQRTTIARVCPPRHRWEKPCEGSTYTDPWEPYLHLSEMRGTIDPNRPDEINETRTWKSDDGLTEYRFKVNLKRCK